ncbi:MAG TPA: hypothetical protein VFY54_02835 [Rubrobacter sp.]|nr:hypothetical protein [Rubrobacter sp.]
MSGAVAVLLGVLAWAGVAAAAIALQEWDQFWGFFVLLPLVVAAWAIGEWVTERVILEEGQ